jgi:hypothetical protein
MALEKKNNAATTSRMLSGYKNILTVAAQYDITHLALPMLMLEAEIRHLFSDAQCVKRAESVVRETRAFLMENASGDNSLKSITLIVPPGAAPAEFFEQGKKIVSNTFNQSM